MLTKLCFPTVIVGSGLAMGQPIDIAIAAVKASAETLAKAVEKAPGRTNSFGQRVAQLAKERVRSRQRLRVAPVTRDSAPEESFGEKLKKAVEERSGAKQHKDQAARERSRYPGYKRQSTKGE
jgi:hypothetical protein